MGTRSLTIVEDCGDELIVMYRQFDGYPEGHGAELAEFLSPFTIINGIPVGSDTTNKANGMGCLAAQIVARFKTDIGGIYLHRSGERDCGEEFRYHVGERDGKPTIRVVDVGYEAADWNDNKGEPDKVLFDGLASEFAEWLASLKQEE